MAIYHLSVQIIGRKAGRSVVAAAAYRSADKLTNQYDGLTHDYTRKHWVTHSEILLPEHAPSAFEDRQILWNSVETAERSSIAQLAREITIAILLLPAVLFCSSKFFCGEGFFFGILFADVLDNRFILPFAF